MKNIYLSETNLFSRNSVVVTLSLPYTLYDDTMMCFLRRLLMSSTLTYPTTKELVIRKKELYNTNISSIVMATGNQLTLSIKLNYLKDKKLDLESSAIELLTDIIFNPHITNHKWNKIDFDDALNVTNYQIESFKDDPESYAKIEGLKLLDDKMAIAYPTYGDEKIIKEITATNIASYYHDFIKRAEASLYLVGEFSDNINSKIDIIGKGLNLQKPKLEIYQSKQFNKEPIIKKEPFKLTQSKLIIGFKANNLTDFESKYVLSLYNYILGGGSFTSKIHHKIRGKRGLAYVAFSHSNRIFNILFAQTAVDPKNVDLAISLIKEAHQEMMDGKFTKQEVQKGISSFVNSVKLYNDTITSYTNHFIKTVTKELDGVADRVSNYKKVTKEDIIKVAQKVSLESIYVLGGEK